MELIVTIDDDVSPGLRRLKDGGANMRAAMGEIAERLLESVHARFAGEYGPGKVPWQKSSAAEAEGRRTLYKTGSLYRSNETSFDETTAMVGVVQSGGPAIYARIHQWGGTIRSRAGKALRTPFGPRASVSMPARPWLGIDADDRTAIAGIIRDHFAGLSGDSPGVPT